jgi:uncharacterized protein (TIRG00374 family)
MKLWGRIVVTVVVLATMFLILPWRDVLGSMGRMPWPVWVGIVLGFLVGHGLGALKWRLAVNAGRGGLAALDALRCYAAGLFANLCLPSIVGGDVLRAVLAGKSTKRPEAVVVGGLADRASDVSALALLIAGGALFARRALPGSAQLVLTVSLVLGVTGALVALFLLIRRPLAAWPPRLRRHLGRMLVALRRLTRRPATAAAVVGLSLAIQTGFILLNAVIGHSIGIDQPLAVWFLAWPVAKLSGLLPISLGGLAIREATLAAALAPFGVAPALGVAASLLWQTVLIAGGLLSGLLWLGLRRHHTAENTATIASPGHV